MGGVRAGQARADEAVQPGAGGLRHRRARRGRAQPERRRRRAQGAEGPALCSHARTAVWCQRRSAWMRVRLLLPCKHAYDQPCSFSKVGSCLAAAMIRKCPLRGASCVKPARGAGCARHPSWRARTDLPSWQSAPGEGKSAWAPTALSAWMLVMESPGECAAYAHLADAPPAVCMLNLDSHPPLGMGSWLRSAAAQYYAQSAVPASCRPGPTPARRRRGAGRGYAADAHLALHANLAAHCAVQRRAFGAAGRAHRLYRRRLRPVPPGPRAGPEGAQAHPPPPAPSLRCHAPRAAHACPGLQARGRPCLYRATQHARHAPRTLVKSAPHTDDPLPWAKPSPD